jgi:hypothetical protein
MTTPTQGAEALPPPDVPNHFGGPDHYSANALRTAIAQDRAALAARILALPIPEPAYPDCFDVPRTGGATRSGFSYDQARYLLQAAADIVKG